MAIIPEDVDYNEDLDRRTRYRRNEDAERPIVTDPWLAGVPSWVKAIAVVGIPGAIALFLVYQVASQLPKIEERQASIEKQLEQQREAIKAETVRMEQVYRQLQRICSNTAKTDDDRQRCFD